MGRRANASSRPLAVRTVLPFTYKRTEMVLAGLSKTQIIDRLKEAVRKKGNPRIGGGSDVLHDVAGRLSRR